MVTVSSIQVFASFSHKFLNYTQSLHFIKEVKASFTFYPEAAEVYR